MSLLTYFVDIVPKQAEYEIPFPIKRLLSIYIHNSTTSVWELIFNSLVRSDRPTYSMRGNAIILDPAPYKKCKMKVAVDA